VSGGIGIRHQADGGPDGWLGYPRTDEIEETGPADDTERRYQKFEGGTIFWTARHHAVAVSKAVDRLVFDPDANLRARLGYPVSGQEGGVQYFENGVVTIRDGAPEAWLRP
jgi:uncharacterized protein with LGFP repeats